MYEMIFKRKSFHLFRNVGAQRLTEEDLQDIGQICAELKPLYPDIRTEFRIVPSAEKLLGRGAEYAIEIYSEEKDNYLLNVGYIGEQLDLRLVERNIGTLWFGVGKPRAREYHGLPFVIMILIAKVDSPDKFRRDMFKSKRLPLEEIWQGEPLDGVSDIVRFAPSACNSQPWRVKREGERLTVYRCRKPGRIGIMPSAAVSTLNRIDMGIFLCFLNLCLDHENLRYSCQLLTDRGEDSPRTLTATYTLHTSPPTP